MGRKNWNSIPDKYRPLPDRLNVVVSRDAGFNDEGCVIYNSVEDAVNSYKTDERETFIIGGGQIYKYSLEKNLIDEMFITIIDQDFEGDTYFPEFDEDEWDKTLLMSHPVDERNPYSFDVWRYTKK